MPDSWRADTFLPLANDALYILLALASRPQHGYGIIRDVEERSAGETVLQTGALYRMLRRLLRDELIEECDAPDRRRRRPAPALLPAAEARPAGARRRSRADVAPGASRSAHRRRQAAATDMRTRLFRALLALLPSAFRARFRDELLDTAATLDRARPVRLVDAPLVLFDAAATVVAIRREMRLEARAVERRSRRSLMDSLLQDVRFAARGLRRDAWFTAFVVAALTLGIGANAAMFGIVDRLLLSGPPHIQDPDRVVRFYLTAQPDGMRRSRRRLWSRELRPRAEEREELRSRRRRYTVNTVVVGAGADAHAAQGGYASETLFPLLGVQPLVGRFFNEDENRPDGAARVAVLGYAAWQRWFGGSRDVIGRDLTIGERAVFDHRRRAARFHRTAVRPGGRLAADQSSRSDRSEGLADVVECAVAARSSGG